MQHRQKSNEKMQNVSVENVFDVLLQTDYRNMSIKEAIYYKKQNKETFDSLRIKTLSWTSQNLGFTLRYQSKSWHVLFENKTWLWSMVAAFPWKKYQNLENLTQNLDRVFDPVSRQKLDDLTAALQGIMHLHDPGFKDAVFSADSGCLVWNSGSLVRKNEILFLGKKQHKIAKTIMSNVAMISERSNIISHPKEIKIKPCTTHHQHLNALVQAEELFPSKSRTIKDT